MSVTTSASNVPPITGLQGEGELAGIVLDWTPVPWETVVDHYAVYGARDADDVAVEPDTLLTKTVYPHFEHRGLGGASERWVYRVVTVDAASTRSRPSDPVTVSSRESVTVSGSPLAVVGEFDGKGLELALSPAGYAQYNATFPDGVDFRYGTDDVGTGWSYLQPGPADSWAGRRDHLFRLRFELEAAPSDDVDLALWLIDSHASIPGSAVLTVNGTEVDRLVFEGGATKGSTQGDSTVPGSPLKPSYIEYPLTSGLFIAGENTLELFKDDGSWIAYDAIGVFARST
ncbi:polysaccharide lyase family protein [Phytoactinopolyspora endophytica]|uniref:polysaccharide lyase family protein n=1 Tax=Phytoactinopolyspora endophytica TaxID=1642495 RepID=UPI00101D3DD1|nr:polysaccharide lyase family protein [Phytoactinopolyspora endophytica]